MFAAANIMFWYRGEDSDDVTAVELVLANAFYTLRALTIGAKYGYYTRAEYEQMSSRRLSVGVALQQLEGLPQCCQVAMPAGFNNCCLSRRLTRAAAVVYQ